jgi:hypothetical protein
VVPRFSSTNARRVERINDSFPFARNDAAADPYREVGDRIDPLDGGPGSQTWADFGVLGYGHAWPNRSEFVEETQPPSSRSHHRVFQAKLLIEVERMGPDRSMSLVPVEG